MADPGEHDVETLHEGRFLRLVRRGRWEFCQRTTGTGVVGLIATTDHDEIVLIEQSRPAVGGVCIELPAGLVGDDGEADEPLESAAKRELLEETGFEADHVERLCHGVVSAA